MVSPGNAGTHPFVTAPRGAFRPCVSHCLRDVFYWRITRFDASRDILVDSWNKAVTFRQKLHVPFVAPLRVRTRKCHL